MLSLLLKDTLEVILFYKMKLVNIKINNERAARVIRPYVSVEVVQGDMTVLQELVARRLGFRRENGWSPRESIHDGQLTN